MVSAPFPRSHDFNPRSPHGERPRRVLNRNVRHNFNPRSPHGERHVASASGLVLKVISIHAPRTGSDGNELDMERCDTISIHAPRTGSDSR